MTLYGFLSREELSVYRKLIQVNGVGPKAALAILSVMGVDDLRFAILSADAKAIAKAPGVGKKTAERILLELHDKISAEDIIPATGDALFEGEAHAEDSAQREAVEALVALGYPQGTARAAVSSALKALPEGADVEDILSAALKEF